MKKTESVERPYVRKLLEVGYTDVSLVGGKSASLGEMLQGLSSAGVRVSEGFSTTIHAYRHYLMKAGLDKKISNLMGCYHKRELSLRETGKQIREAFLEKKLPESVAESIIEAYRSLSGSNDDGALSVAVRSSATAEDQPGASFAGMLDTFLNVQGEEALLEACRRCFASLYTDRAIRYREKIGMHYLNASVCVAVQYMVRSDMGAAGVMFSIDKDTGFPDMVTMTASWGLGESDVAGETLPDEYRVYKLFLGGEGGNPILERNIGYKLKKYVLKPGGGIQHEAVERNLRHARVLSDEEIRLLSRWAVIVEDYYGRPMDMEWARDGVTGQLFMVQARPITDSFKRDAALNFYRLDERGQKLLTGVSIGEGIARGRVFRVKGYEEMGRVSDNTILVAEQANTGWISDLLEKNVKALVTDFGSRNSHAALICREVGIPGLVGTLNATEKLEQNQEITVQSIEGDHGFVYDGAVAYAADSYHLRDVPYTDLNVMINIASDAAAFQWWRLPCRGVGLVRMDYIFENIIQIHPLAAIHTDRIQDRNARFRILALTEGYESPREYFVSRLTSCLAKIAASRLPDPVVVRPTHFESQEYGQLIGGAEFEKELGVHITARRGVGRYLSDGWREAFSLECEAIRRVREDHGFKNVHVMMPYCEMPEEAEKILHFFASEGLRRGVGGFRVFLCCDDASNWKLAKDFAPLFDGFSLDVRKLQRWVQASGKRNSENDMKQALLQIKDACHEAGGTVTVRGRLLTDAFSLISLLVEVGIDALSINPEAIPRVMQWIVEAEKNI